MAKCLLDIEAKILQNNALFSYRMRYVEISKSFIHICTIQNYFN